MDYHGVLNMSSEPIFLAYWMREGEWEVRIDGPHIPEGQRHIHIRRKSGRKGEFAWNKDGSRHDKGKFPKSEEMIGRAKEIAARKLGVPIDSLQFLSCLPKGGHIVILQEGIPFASETYMCSEFGLTVLRTDDWLILTGDEETKDEEG